MADTETGEIESKQNSSTGYIVPSHGNGHIAPIRTSERAREVANMRWNRWRRAAEAGIVVGVLGPDAPVTLAGKVQAYIELVAVQAKIASDADNYNSPAAFRNVRSAIGADVGMPSGKGGDDGGGGVTLHLSADVAASIAAVLAGALRRGE